MIQYAFEEEKKTALLLAELINDSKALKIINKDGVDNAEEARHLSRFFWRMVDFTAQQTIDVPFDESAKYWVEKLYNTLGGYLETAGYEAIWDEEVDKA